MEHYGYIYKITNRLSGKSYIGQTTQTIEARMRQHCQKNVLSNDRMAISKAIKKYGSQNFDIEALCSCFNQSELDLQEISFADIFNTMAPDGYNLRVGRGFGKMAQSSRDKVGDALRGKKKSTQHVEALIESHSKTTYYLINHDGLEVQFNNIKRYCKTNGIALSGMCQLIRGERLEYKGWKKDPLYPSSDRLTKKVYVMKVPAGKTYYAVDPDGNPVTIFNMREFCRINNLSDKNMSAVMSGKKHSCGGWRRDIEDNRKKYISLRGNDKIKTYYFIDPNGIAVEIPNLVSFCSANNLCYSKMCSVAKGKRSHHRGWRIDDGTNSGKYVKPLFNKKTRTWHFIDPSGVKVTVFGLKAFCKDNNLLYDAMLLVAKDKASHHGWKKDLTRQSE